MKLMLSLARCKDFQREAALFSSQMMRKAFHRANCVNELFEFAQAHRYCQEQAQKWSSSRGGSKLLAYTLKELDEEAESFRLSFSSYPLNSDLSPSQKFLGVLAKSLCPMFVWGVANLGVGMFAQQMSLGVLLGLTWGSFRWNENELKNALLHFSRQDTEEGRFFQNHPEYYKLFLALVLSSYLVVYFCMRNHVSNAVQSKSREIADPYLQRLEFHYYEELFKAFLKNQEDISNVLENPAKERFAEHMKNFQIAHEKQDLKSLRSLSGQIQSLVEETDMFHSSQKAIQIFQDSF